MKRLALLAATLLSAVGVVGCADTTAPNDAAARAAAAKQQLESATQPLPANPTSPTTPGSSSSGRIATN